MDENSEHETTSRIATCSIVQSQLTGTKASAHNELLGAADHHPRKSVKVSSNKKRRVELLDKYAEIVLHELISGRSSQECPVPAFAVL